jgi:peptidoglycan L-alanyl-D-glutamate endopeptidase CwlK
VRDIRLLHPELLVRFGEFAMRMAQAKIPFFVTATGRTVEEQEALYAQGRQPLEKVNALRKKAGLWLIGEKENGYTVTSTLKSRHLLYGGVSEAFDIVIVKGKHPSWNPKEDVNNDGLPDYDQAGAIGEACGLEWGGRFPKVDRCHFQLPRQLTRKAA